MSEIYLSLSINTSIILFIYLSDHEGKESVK